MLARKRVAFLFNHEELHQVAHVAPVANAMSMMGGNIDIHIVTSTPEQEAEVRKHIRADQCANIRFHRISASAIAGFAGQCLGHAIPTKRISALKKNRDLFSGFDALVVPETTSFLLKSHFGLDHLKIIYLPHGAGDRAVGFRKVTAKADFVLLSGKKVRDRMVRANLVSKQGHAIIGYPKFDQFANRKPRRLFDNDRPTLLYNPHFDPLLSSWYQEGHKILEYFADQDQFNLIFTPHVMLFRRKLHASVEHRLLRWRKAFPRDFRNIPHMHIDLGSTASIDMTYTNMADIYLGDASSQVYEFIRKPRPCLFMNCHAAQWRDDPNYLHWNLGDVIESAEALPDALAISSLRHGFYRPAQERLLHATFDIQTTPSAERAALAIMKFLGIGEQQRAAA
ncbi:MAG: hypothetical protein R3E11_05605 [Sphingobium sp.]|nr:hypothetical protein [Sphingobium sp.]MCP5398970.1 hypothetical protein [Sphingomonas sp.]